MNYWRKVRIALKWNYRPRYALKYTLSETAEVIADLCDHIVDWSQAILVWVLAVLTVFLLIPVIAPFRLVYLLLVMPFSVPFTARNSDERWYELERILRVGSKNADHER